MMKIAVVLLFTFIAFASIAQELPSTGMAMYLKTDEASIPLDSTDFNNISPEWIKEITIVSPPYDPDQDPDYTPPQSMYIELKKRYTRKFLKNREQ